MRPAVLLVTCLALSACGGAGSIGSLGRGSTGSLGSIGSLGFGGARQAGAVETRATLPDLVPEGRRVVVTDTRVLAGQITRAELLPVVGGTLLRATGRPQTPGAYNAELLIVGREGSTLLVDMRMNAQSGTTMEPGSVTVARRLSGADLAGITRIALRSASGTVTLRR